MAAEPPDPSANISMGQLPESCRAGTSASCENAVVYYLDKARAAMGLSPYALPADFTQLAPDRQIFVLSDLDRLAYSLRPVAGLNAQLSGDAARGVADGGDPSASSWPYGANSWYSNWAGAYVNTPAAYYGWMYDDGAGSGNVDCTQASDPGCWGHRHNILTRGFGEPDEYEAAMGAAAGTESRSGDAGYAMLILIDSPRFSSQPPYYYSWAEAQADGAGSNAYDPGVPDLSSPPEGSGSLTPDLRLSVRGRWVHLGGDPVLRGHRVVVTVRREAMPCAFRRGAPCAWAQRGPVRRIRLTLTTHTAFRLRRPGAWERLAVRARASGFELEGQRYTDAAASILLLGPKPHRGGR